MKLVSACLLGINCNFKGGNFLGPRLAAEFAAGNLLPVCPELLGGLPLPRAPAEMQGGGGWSVLAGTAKVVAAAMLKGQGVRVRTVRQYRTGEGEPGNE